MLKLNEANSLKCANIELQTNNLTDSPIFLFVVCLTWVCKDWNVLTFNMFCGKFLGMGMKWYAIFSA
jgi:hypothetical protein